MPLVILVVGGAIAAATHGVAQIVGLGLITVALTLAISLVFLEVGLSEDRERAREQAARRDRPRGR